MERGERMLLMVALVAVIGIGAWLVREHGKGEIVRENSEWFRDRVDRALEHRFGRAGNVQYAAGYLDLPMEFRVNNYAGGSCVHASMETLFYWQGYPELAQWWRQSYAGGEYSSRLNRRLDAAGVRYAYTMGNDRNVAGKNWAFLEKCVELRLGCAVNWPGNHMVTLVGIDEQNVYLVDNNSTHRITTLTREQFGRSWTGWAVTPVYTPPPPEPYQLARR